MKRVIVLVGPKGAGKSTIGHLLATELGIGWVRVEPLFLQVRGRLGAAGPDYERLGFEAVVETVCDALLRHDTVCFETTGASGHLPWLLSELARIARVLPVQVLADPDQCIARIRRRDASLQIPVSDDQVERINAAAADVVLPWAAVIDNRPPLNRDSITSSIRNLLEKSE